MVGVGDLGNFAVGIFSPPDLILAPGLGRTSCAMGRFWITLKSNLLVRLAAFWIIETWCAKFGRIAGINRGVKGTMTSGAKLTNSASHRSAVDC